MLRICLLILTVVPSTVFASPPSPQTTSTAEAQAPAADPVVIPHTAHYDVSDGKRMLTLPHTASVGWYLDVDGTQGHIVALDKNVVTIAFDDGIEHSETVAWVHP